MAPSDPLDPGSPLEPKSWSYLQQFMPSIQENGYFTEAKGIEFTYHSLELVQDSSQFNTDDWILMADIISANYANYDGFIVIHGTDTLAYSAAALSFMLQGLSKPVVLTGSQLPISHSRTDAVNNLSNAIHIAGHKAFNLPPIPEVCICFNDRVFRGNRTTKFSTRDFEGFDSPNYPALAELEESIRCNQKFIHNPDSTELKLMTNFEDRVIDISLFPGIRPENLGQIVTPDTRGLIIRTFGSGNAPCTPEFLEFIKKVRHNGTTVLFITQCYHGGVELGKYRSSQAFYEMGVVSGGDMTNEAALAKMMWALGHFEGDKVHEILLESIVGERTM